MALDKSWTGQENETMFGHKDWEYLTSTGQKSHAEIIDALWGNQNLLHAKNRAGMDRAQQGGTHGLFNQIQQAAQDATSWNNITGVNDWNYGVWGGQGFGKEDIEAARDMGASEYQLRQLYDRANQLGINTSGRHAQEIANTAPIAPWDYGAHGEQGFGMRDVDAIGDDLDKLRETRDFASEYGLNIGPGVRGHMAGLEQREFDAQVAKQQNDLMIQQEKVRQMERSRAATGAEYGRLASMRGGGSQTLGASGAATFKGKGLRSSENRRGKGRGTGQFKRPYGTSNLSIAATGKGNQQSTLNL